MMAPAAAPRMLIRVVVMTVMISTAFYEMQAGTSDNGDDGDDDEILRSLKRSSGKPSAGQCLSKTVA